MKKLLILLAATALSAGSAAAQTSPTQKNAAPAPAPRRAPNAPAETMQRRSATAPEQLADRLTQQLDLSAEQRAQLVGLEQSRRTEADTRRANAPATGAATAPDRAAIRANRQARQQEHEMQLKSILTPEQYARYTQLRQERQNKRGGYRMKTKT